VDGAGLSAANTIEDNNGVGIKIESDSISPNIGNEIDWNNISGNVYGGIDLEPLGPNGIDPLDADSGPNGLLNPPGPFTATITGANEVIIKGVYQGLPNRAFRIVLYLNDICDSLGLGQGQESFTSFLVTTDGNGVALLDYTSRAYPGPPPPVVTATAKDTMTGNTSEFSACSDQVVSFIDLSLDVDDKRDSVSFKDTLNYEMVVTNIGIDTATGVILQDTLPVGVTYVSDTSTQGTCELTDSVLTCALGTIPPGDSVRVTLVVVADSTGWLRNTARVGAIETDPVTANNIDRDSTWIRDAATDVQTDQPAELPERYALAQNYPNPFNPATRIAFDLPTAAEVRLEVYNMIGQRVAVLHEGRLPAGRHTAQWEAGDFASGVYLYRLIAGRFVQTRKMVLLK
jgi:uncharacterized repeat protein (TIGR01451 family)